MTLAVTLHIAVFVFTFSSLLFGFDHLGFPSSSNFGARDEYHLIQHCFIDVNSGQYLGVFVPKMYVQTFSSGEFLV